MSFWIRELLNREFGTVTLCSRRQIQITEIGSQVFMFVFFRGSLSCDVGYGELKQLITLRWLGAYVHFFRTLTPVS